MAGDCICEAGVEEVVDLVALNDFRVPYGELCAGCDGGTADCAGCVLAALAVTRSPGVGISPDVAEG